MQNTLKNTSSLSGVAENIYPPKEKFPILDLCSLVPFGKYKGITIKELALKDIYYAKWFRDIAHISDFVFRYITDKSIEQHEINKKKYKTNWELDDMHYFCDTSYPPY